MTAPARGQPVSQILSHATQTLIAAGCDTPRLDVEVLLAHVLSRERAWLYAHPGHRPSSTQLTAFHSLVCRRAAREPVAYLVGCREFYGLDFTVGPHVLVPRPETERLIEVALQWAMNLSPLRIIADVGTGSGAIAVTLATKLPQIHVIATDTSASALVVARHNASCHGTADRVHFVQGSLLAPLNGTFDLIASNPPYLSHAELASAPPEVARWEPRAALDGGRDGLAIIRLLLRGASKRLHPGGALLIEIGAGQGTDVLRLAGRYFPQATAEIIKDHAARDRILFVRCAR